MIEALELCISAMRSLMEVNFKDLLILSFIEWCFIIHEIQDEEDTPELTETQNDESSDEQEDEQMVVLTASIFYVNTQFNSFFYKSKLKGSFND